VSSGVTAHVRRITLLTDFGTADGYVGAMKGVIAAILPDAIIDDISHDIAPGDVTAAAWCLASYWSLYPPGTVHVCVVDPGVGTERRALAATTSERTFVAPDNGLLSVMLGAPDRRVVSVTEPRYMRPELSMTFHGRDVFAPVAAHIAAGLSIDRLGPGIDDAVVLRDGAAEADGVGGTRGIVVHVDRFGNLITDVHGAAAVAAHAVHVFVGEAGPFRVVGTYAQADAEEVVALIGSTGALEVAVRDGSAARRLGAGRGTAVRVTRDDSGRGTRTPERPT
jgi:S-adenosylmethionine hydrolase